MFNDLAEGLCEKGRSADETAMNFKYDFKGAENLSSDTICGNQIAQFLANRRICIKIPVLQTVVKANLKVFSRTIRIFYDFQNVILAVLC